MGDRKKKWIEYSLVVGIFFSMGLPLLLMQFGSGDELWNYNFARNVLAGMEPYKDFSMVQTPLSAYILAPFLALFGNNLVVYRIAGVLLLTAVFSVLYLICKRVTENEMIAFVASSFTYVLIYRFWIYNYNHLILLVVLMIMLLEIEGVKRENPFVYQFVVPFLYGLTPLIKQSTGFVLLTAYICLRTGELLFKKCSIRKFSISISVSLVPLICYIAHLLYTATFANFVDYAIKGISTFKHRIFIWDFVRSTPIAFFMVLFIGCTIILSIRRIALNNSIVDRYIHMKLLAISFASGIVAYPLSEYSHMMIAFIPYIVCFFASVKVKKYSMQQNVVCIMVAVVLMSFSSFSIVSNAQDLVASELRHFEGVPIEKRVEENIEVINAYIIQKENEGIKVIVADECASACMIPLDKYNKDFDMLLVGNLGTQSIEDLLSKNDNAIYLVARNEDTMNFQAHFDLVHYIKENYVKIGEVSNLDAYQRID